MENAVPGSRRWLCVGFLIWNLIGIAAFVGQYYLANYELATLPPDQQAMWRAMPGWAWVAYAVAVLAGTAGAWGLVKRKAWSVTAYLIGLIAVVLQFFSAFVLQDGIATVGANAVFFPLFIIALALVQWWLARKWRGEDWLS